MANLFNRTQNNIPVDDETWTPLGLVNPEPPLQHPAEPTQPEPVITTPEPASKAPRAEKAKKEKPKKAEPAPAKRKVGRPRKDPDSAECKQSTTISFPANLHEMLAYMSFRTKNPMSNIVSDVISDMMQSTYECEAAACHQQFILLSGIDEECQKPNFCPCCGSHIRRINHTKGVTF